MLSVNRTCLLHGGLKKFQFFHLDQCQLSYGDNLYVRSVFVCLEWVFLFLFWVMNQSERYITKIK